MDYGLVGGIGEGLQAGMETYMRTRQMQESKRQDDLARALQAKLAGVQLNKEGTGWVDAPESEERRKLELEKLKSEVEKNKRGYFGGDQMDYELKMQRLEEGKRKGEEAAYKKSPKGRLESVGAEAKTKMGAIASALQSTTQLEDIMADKGSVPYDKTKAPFGRFLFSKDQVSNLRDKLTDDIGRMRSGGAINLDEERRFLSMLPSEGDNPDSIASKLQNLRQEFQTRFKGYGFQPEEYVGAIGDDPKGYGLVGPSVRDRMSQKGLIKAPEAQTKVVGGKTYRKVQGGWEEVSSTAGR